MSEQSRLMVESMADKQEEDQARARVPRNEAQLF
jgi:hypothetical protein